MSLPIDIMRDSNAKKFEMLYSFHADRVVSRTVIEGELCQRTQDVVFHMNIRSFNTNHTSLYAYLLSLDIHFDVLVLSEIWNYNLEFYQNVFHGYTFHYVAPECTNVGWWCRSICEGCVTILY